MEVNYLLRIIVQYKMKKIILICLAVLLFSNFVGATAYYKYGELPISIERECFYNGALCVAAYTCTISVYDENSEVIVDNAAMTRTPAYYYYNVSQLLDNGEYRSRATCTNGVLSGSEIFYFEVTPAGTPNRQNFFIILAIAPFVVLGLAYLLRSNEVGVLSGMIFVIAGMYTMINGIDGVYDLYSRAIAGVALALGILFMITSGYGLWNSYNSMDQ